MEDRKFLYCIPDEDEKSFYFLVAGDKIFFLKDDFLDLYFYKGHT